MFELCIWSITNRVGGIREKKIYSAPHTIELSGTWNREHKVVNIVEMFADESGHRDSYSIDLQTERICG